MSLKVEFEEGLDFGLIDNRVRIFAKTRNIFVYLLYKCILSMSYKTQIPVCVCVCVCARASLCEKRAQREGGRQKEVGKDATLRGCEQSPLDCILLLLRWQTW